jgi:hypothetical protein
MSGTSYLADIQRAMRTSGSSDTDRPLKLAGKSAERISDLFGLLGQGGHHAIHHLWLVPNQFERSYDQREVIVDVMTHGGQLTVQLV